MPRRNPYGWTFCPIASLYSVPSPVEPVGGSAKLKVYKKPAYFAAFFAAGFLAAAFLAAGFFAAVLVAAFLVPFFAAGAEVASAAALIAVADFFSATVTMMCASLRW